MKAITEAQANQIAKQIRQEFGVPCVAMETYYMWNPPPDCYDDNLRQLRATIEKRIQELEQQAFDSTNKQQ